MKLKNLLQVAVLSLSGIFPAFGQESGPTVIQTVYEAFALDKSEAAAMQRENLTDPKMYARMIAGLESGKVTQKKLQVIRGLSGQVATNESIVEFIYPTEFQPPELPNAVGVSSPSGEKPSPIVELNKVRKGPGWQAGKFPATPTTPHAFNTKHLGDTLELEAFTVPGDNPVIDLRSSVTYIKQSGMTTWGQGLAETKVPGFEVQKIKSWLVMKSGVPTCVGTISPGPNEQPKKGEEQVWFAFFTVTLVEVKE